MSLTIGSPAYPFSPYCGAPPTSLTVWSRWNLDPILLLAFIGVAAVFIVLERRSVATRDRRRHARLLFFAGWGLAGLLLISPFCALSVALFSARVTQHMLLAVVAAPLVALGLPRARLIAHDGELPAAGLFAVLLWLWHAPGPYAATFRGDLIYWTMHLTTFAAAVWFWSAILRSPPGRLAWSVGAAVFTSLQMAFLGAIITFAGRPQYSPHALTTVAWGLTPLQDQQLGGAIMWVPAGVLFVAAILAPLARVLRAHPPGAALVLEP